MGPIQFFLGIFGMTRLTAYVGLLRIDQLKEGETVFVSAVSRAVLNLGDLNDGHILEIFRLIGKYSG